MKIKNLQFIRWFLTQEIDLGTDTVNKMLETSVQVHHFGEPDTAEFKNNTVVCQSPSSLTMFLFKVTETILSTQIESLLQRDKMGLALLHMCRSYVHLEQSGKYQGPPVLISLDKIPVVSVILRDIVQPLVDPMDFESVLFAPCNYTDTCRIIKDASEFEHDYGVSQFRGSDRTFPMILCNSNVHNDAAQQCHMVVKCLEASFGRDRSEKVIKNILLGEELALTSRLLTVLKTIKGCPRYVLRFLSLLESHLSESDLAQSAESQWKRIKSDQYLNQYIKTSQSNTQVARQWSQWSMMMGLIEKQLDPMRGSMWPASETVKPHEDRLRLIIHEKAEEKGKNQANFEEMLEAARNLYNHNAVEPGNLIEEMLKENRIWKQ